MRVVLSHSLFVTLVLACSVRAQLVPGPGPIEYQIKIDQRLDNQVPLDLVFTDETGKQRPLSSFMRGKPVILSLVYYRCPGLCTMTLNGMVKSFRPLKFDVGREFDVLTVSIDPSEKPDLAASKKAGYLRDYGRAGAETGWHFLTGDEQSIAKLADSVGFRYVYDPVSKQFAHASVIMVLTPQGKVSRYFYGLEYAPRDVQFGLIDASQNKVGSLADALVLLCYHYDPTKAKYGLAVLTLIRTGGIVTLLAIGTFIFICLRKERRGQLNVQSSPPLPGAA